MGVSTVNSFEVLAEKLDAVEVHNFTILGVGKVYNKAVEVPEVSLDVIPYPSIVRSWTEESEEEELAMREAGVSMIDKGDQHLSLVVGVKKT